MAVSLLFTGHMIDLPDRPEPRFPASVEEAARVRIGEAIDRGVPKLSEALGFASGARGGDILFHEECRGRGIGTVIVLPFEPDEFVRTSVEGTALEGDWPRRFWDLWNATPVDRNRVLGPAPGDEAYAKCNTELLKMARQHGRVHLIALWDGKGGDGPGGTADLVSRLREEDKPDIIAPSDLHN
jgi:hypothetical protein